MSEPYKPPVIAGRQIWDIDDLARLNSDIGHHWFKPETLRYFNGRVCDELFYGPVGLFFVSSERDMRRIGGPAPREYSVRRVVLDGEERDAGSIEAFGDFGGCRTLHRAKKIARLAAAGIVTTAETPDTNRYDHVACVECGNEMARYQMVVHKSKPLHAWCIGCLSGVNMKRKDMQ